jgi:hypothetical protein
LQTACGRISPKIRIAVTAIRMAAMGLSSRSRKMGRASMQAELQRSKVHRRWCGLRSTCGAGSTEVR